MSWFRARIVPLIILSILVSCRTASADITNPTPPTETGILTSPSPMFPPTATAASDTPSPLAPTLTFTLVPSPIAAETDTPTPTQVDVQTELSQALAQIIASRGWQDLGLSTDRRSSWETFSHTRSGLAQGEVPEVEGFVQRWDELHKLAKLRLAPADVEIGYRVREVELDSGGTHPVLYAIDEKTSAEGGAERLLLTAYDRSGEPGGLLLSETIPGTTQRISADGDFVEYLDAQGEWLVKADARILDTSRDQDAILKDILMRENLEAYFVNEDVFPRYRFNIPGVDSGFFAVEKLTLKQIGLLYSTFELFDTGVLGDLKGDVFLPLDQVFYIITRDPEPYAAAVAYPLGGTPRKGIVMLFSKVLFANRFDTASALAHEAGHIWQGKSPGCGNKEGMLSMEIGDKTIPKDFLSWSGAQVFQAIRDKQIGTYHISIWVLNKFGQTDAVKVYTEVIHTGYIHGFSIINCK